MVKKTTTKITNKTTTKRVKKTTTRKTPQPSMKASSRPKIVPYAEWYKYNYMEPEKPISEKYLVQLGEAFIAHIKHDYDCLSLISLYNKADMHYDQIKRHCNASPRFRAYIAMCKQLIAEKRERRMGLKGDIDKQVYMYTQAYYCPITREMMELRAELAKKKEEDRQQVFHIVRDLGDGKPKTTTWARGNALEEYKKKKD